MCLLSQHSLKCISGACVGANRAALDARGRIPRSNDRHCRRNTLVVRWEKAVRVWPGADSPRIDDA